MKQQKDWGWVLVCEENKKNKKSHGLTEKSSVKGHNRRVGG